MDEWQRMLQEAFEALKHCRKAGSFESVEEFKQAVRARPLTMKLRPTDRFIEDYEQLRKRHLR